MVVVVAALVLEQVSVKQLVEVRHLQLEVLKLVTL